MSFAHRLRSVVAATTAASLLALAGCSSPADNNASEPTDTPASNYNPQPRDNIKDGGTFTTALGELSEQQNPFHVNTTASSYDVWSWYNPQLGLSDAEGNLTWNSDYITDVTQETVDGKTRVTYTISDQATWNDGTPIDWTAIEATWKINAGTDERFTPYSTEGYEKIASVTRGDSDKQAIVDYDSIYPWWEYSFGFLAHPALTDPNNYNDYLQKLHPEWGAGPYTVDYADFNKGEVAFKRNDKWWGEPGKLDKRVFLEMEAQAAVNAFKNGEIDAVSYNNKAHYNTTKDVSGAEVRIARATGQRWLTLNSKSPQLEDVKVREAIATTIDRETIGNILVNGLPYSETPPGSLGQLTSQEDYQNNFGKVVPATDPDKAKTLLDEAGWTEGGDGIREKDGEKLSLRYVLLGETELTKAVATAVQKMLKDVGVDVRIETRPQSDASEVTGTYDFDIYIGGMASAAPQGFAYFNLYYGTDSGLVRSQTGTPEFDEKIAELQKLPTVEEQNARANELEVEAMRQFGIIPLYNGPEMFAVKSDLANYGPLGFASLPIQNIGYVK